MGISKGLAPRRAALEMVGAVLDEARSLDVAKAAPGFQALPPEGRARAGALAAETLRWLGLADALIAPLMRQPLKSRARIARDALRLAVTEVGALGAPAHAAVDAAVELAKSDSGSRALAGLVNAVARKACAAAPAAFAAPDAARRAAPDWLARALEADWGDEADAILAASWAKAPMDLTARADAASWVEALEAELLPTGSLRRAGGRLTGLPGFEQGAWWVQDAAAAIPARLLGEVAGRRVLDLCAAPGGKTMQFAARGAKVTALDVSETRLARLRENLDRTGLSAEIVVADALDWRPETLFDAVLLDAPCTATGTLRRHPDLPHLKGVGDITALAALQDRMLDAAWKLVAPGGALLFCTCSLFKAEGEDRAGAFLARAPDANVLPVRAGEVGDPVLIDAAGQLRCRPDLWAERGGLDGFFAARFVKRV